MTSAVDSMCGENQIKNARTASEDIGYNADIAIDSDVNADNETELKIDQSSVPSNAIKTLYCIRHSQSEYNATVRTLGTWLTPSFWANGFDPKIRDPDISEHGNEQIALLRQNLDKFDFLNSFKIDLIVLSPLQRAMKTGLGGLSNQLQSTNIPILAHDLLREWMDTLGDVGLLKSKLTEMEQYSTVDFSLIENNVWWCTGYHNRNDSSIDANLLKREGLTADGGVIKESNDMIHERILLFKQWLTTRPESNIIIVGHSRWLREMVGAYSKLENCQMMKVIMCGTDIQSWDIIDFDTVVKPSQSSDATPNTTENETLQSAATNDE